MLKAKDRGLSRMRKQNKASLHKEVGLLVFLLLVAGCMTPQQKLAYYGCWWNCTNMLGETGFCCEKQVPEYDRYIFNCEYAGNRVVGNGN